MKIERCTFANRSPAWRCTAGSCELVVVTGIGPRIYSLRRDGGPNLLQEDPSGLSVGEWRLYGGHRFTVAPESDRSYEPDNTPCEVEVRDGELSIAANQGRDGARRILVIRAGGGGCSFELTHRLENLGTRDWRGALWAITCVPPRGRVIGEATEGSFRFWPGAQTARWRADGRRVSILPGGSRSKGGWHGDPAWVASVQDGSTFLVHAPDAAPRARCVDGGCNVEVFTCADYTELETLGGEVTIEPGGCAVHRQWWHALSKPLDAGELARLVRAPRKEVATVHVA